MINGKAKLEFEFFFCLFSVFVATERKTFVETFGFEMYVVMVVVMLWQMS